MCIGSCCSLTCCLCALIAVLSCSGMTCSVSYQPGHHARLHVEVDTDRNVINCECGVFDAYGWPCAHAYAAARHHDRDRLMIDRMLSDHWNFTASRLAYDARPTTVSTYLVRSSPLLPHTGKRRGQGRPRVARLRSSGEHVTQLRTCGFCSQDNVFHDARNCPARGRKSSRRRR